MYTWISLYELKTTKDNVFWFNVYSDILSINIHFFIPFLFVKKKIAPRVLYATRVMSAPTWLK